MTPKSNCVSSSIRCTTHVGKNVMVLFPCNIFQILTWSCVHVQVEGQGSRIAELQRELEENERSNIETELQLQQLQQDLEADEAQRKEQLKVSRENSDADRGAQPYLS